MGTHTTHTDEQPFSPQLLVTGSEGQPIAPPADISLLSSLLFWMQIKQCHWLVFFQYFLYFFHIVDACDSMSILEVKQYD